MTALDARARKSAGLACFTVAATVVLAACGSGGGSSSSTTNAGSGSSASSGGSASSTPSSSQSAGSTSGGAGGAPVTITIQSFSGGDADALTQQAALFKKQNPNVTIKIAAEGAQQLTTELPHLLSGSNPPDIVRLPEFGNLVKDKLLLNLDSYATKFGWDKWPQSQFSELRINDQGVTGEGSIYGAGPGYVIQGVLFNRKLASQIGMTQPPKTIAAFEKLLAAAKAKGFIPIEENGVDDGTDYPLQDLQMAYANGIQNAADWVYGKKGATFDTKPTLQAATKLQAWAKAGYFNTDVNSTTGDTVAGKFVNDGKAVFMVNGAWQMPTADKKDPKGFGFFVFPGQSATDAARAPSAPWQFGIAAKSKHPDVAAAFMNFLYTNTQARQLSSDVAGYAPAGPADAPAVKVKAGTGAADVAAAFRTVAKGNGLAPFYGNATGQIRAGTIDPQLQLLVASKVTPEQFVKNVQAGYAKQLNH